MTQNSLHIRTVDKDSAIVSLCLSLLIVLVFIQTSDQFLHWFLFPVTLCGILIGIDAIDWFRGRLSIFDPVGIIGLLGFHFFFLAPLFHVSWDFWMGGDTTPPPDWRPWIGWMAILNFLGIWIYRFSRNLAFQSTKNPAKQIVWQLNRRRFIPILCLALMFSAVLQLLVYQKFGGISNYIEAATRAANREGEGEFAGSGIIFLFSESFPILAMMGFALFAQKNKKMRNWTILILVLLVFIVLQMLFGGLRGSRSNTIWALFWGAGIIHFWIRRITKKEIAIGLVFMVIFMYIYGFFKTGGLEGLNKALEGQEERASLEKKSGRSWQGLVLQDLGRSDVQAFVLYRLMQHDSDYQYAWGRTYYAAFSMLVPSIFWPDKPPDKIKEGTEAQFGMGSYHPQLWASSKVYGLAGETMLNFGPIMIPFAFIFLGVIVGNVRRFLFTWQAADVRLILLPFLVNYCFVILVGDLDNQIYFLLKNGGFPFIVLLLSSEKIKIKGE
ncbi:hypothetical protein [Floridanema evergladense]|uniref:O-antigen polysaccharide polymerase Wzy n=1 Tax=Floridaenema evergladense BLCC-F167 TaxID=3153639 RepID=A0ABV4WLT6_9CYAN